MGPQTKIISGFYSIEVTPFTLTFMPMFLLMASPEAQALCDARFANSIPRYIKTPLSEMMEDAVSATVVVAI